MLNFINKIQSASYKKRQRFLIISTSIIMFVIVVVWIFLLQFEFSGSNFRNSIGETTSPFKIIKNTFSKIYGDEEGTASTYYSIEGNATVVTPMKEKVE